MAYLRSVHMPFLFQLQFTTFSVLWLAFSLLLGLTYAYLLYRKKSELSPQLKKILFALRTLTVTFTAFLLFAPFIKTTNKTVEKPLVFILQDNSESISVSKPANFSLNQYQQQLNKLTKDLSENYELKTLTFGTSVQAGIKPNFAEKSSNISSAFEYILDRFSNRNIGAVILASDGIYNKGANPFYISQNIKAPVYTIALGDTIPKKDLLISNINYNNIVYQGNSFQIEVNAEAYQSKGSGSKLTISGKSGILFSKQINISANEFRQVIPIILPATQKGIQKYTATISAISGELSKENNSQTFFIDVIDGKQKVFILANSPHPDITAIKQSIESNKNYEVKTGFPENFNRQDLEKSNLIILHQLPSTTFSIEKLKPLIANKNIWFILGNQSSTGAFSSPQNTLNLTSTNLPQEATAHLNPDFYDFVLSESTRTKLQNFAPLLTPFGNYSLKSQSTILLYQQIGKLKTDKPLLIFSKEGETRTSVLAGEGLWRWRLEDFKENSNHEAVDELISKTIQLLSSKEDKRRFRVYSAKNTFDESEHVQLNAELYNEAYELVNTPDVSVSLKSGKKIYPYLFSRTGNSYVLDAGILPPGEYSYTATTQLGKNKHAATGKFIINRQQAELLNTTANHQLLYSISKQTGGELVYPKNLSDLSTLLKRNELIKTIAFENKQYEELINKKWLFFLIAGLLSLEWFSRKRNGEI